MNIRKISLVAGLVFCCLSCYQKEITKTVEYSPGAWDTDRKNYIFLRWERDYFMPKGITRFPDGGIPKYVRDETFVCMYSKDTNSVRVITEGEGVPRGYPASARFSWKADFIVYKIWNADEAQNLLNPVILLNLKTLESSKFFEIGEMPELSPSADRIASIRKNSIWLMKTDGTGGNIIFKSSGFELIFLMWEKENLMDLYVREKGRFTVYTLNLSDMSMNKSDKPYIQNFGNDSTTEILKIRHIL